MGAEAERYLRRLAEVSLQRRDGPAAVEAAADVLVFLDAVPEAVGHAVLNDFMVARAVRDPGHRAGLHGVPVPVLHWHEWNRPVAEDLPARPGDGLRVVPIGAAAVGGRDGEGLRLLTLAVVPGRAVLVTVAGSISPDRRPGRDQVPVGPYGPHSLADLGLTFTVDGGEWESARVFFYGGGTCDGVWWSLQVVLREVAGIPGQLGFVGAADGVEVARVEVPAGFSGLSGLEGFSDGGGTGGTAEQLLDSMAAGLLWLALWPVPDDWRRSRIAAMADALIGAGLVPDASPAWGRFGALVAELGAGGSDTLPAEWADVLASRDRNDGVERVYPAAAILPGLDGAQFAIAGLVSTAESATLRVLAWGWSPDETPALAPPFVWWARDDTGRWHVGRVHWHSVTRQAVVMDVTLLPALHPAATALEVIVTGRSGRVRATVDLQP